MSIFVDAELQKKPQMKRFTLISAVLLLSTAAFSAKNKAWAPAGDNIKTRWAEQVDPSAPLPEYPRPQLVRSEWMNLNGLWNYGITEAASADFSVEGQILVPFAVESSLSGVARTVTDADALWYERTFTVPSAWKGRSVLLHFGAVDWKAEVWLNGSKLGEHTGGYTPFSFDITPYLKKSGKQTLRLKVLDATDTAWQPRGKQWMLPDGIWYTPVTGIWQTVWMEPVQSAHVNNYYAVSDIDKGSISLSINAEGLQDGDVLRSRLLADGSVIAEGEGAEVLFSVPEPRLWSPDSPFLYDIEISVDRAGTAVDAVKGYTAMRKVSVFQEPNPTKYRRIALNGKQLFQYGPLDQGWWPDGLYTAPTDEALRYDLERTKAWGFNMIRKHIKVEPARWYWYCDKLGILVWQDMPSIGDHDKDATIRSEEVKKAQKNVWSYDSWLGGTDCIVPREWKDNYYKEWGEIIDALKGFQSIVVWIPFNEAWGQFDTPQVVRFTRKKDPTRLINPSSGGNYDLSELGDILDVHHYSRPMMNIFERKVINVVGEYGGIGLPVEGHLWKVTDKNWGYGGVKKNAKQALDYYEDYADMLKDLIKTGCAGAVYTQTTDVETEVNGIMTYDREVVKLDEKKLREINLGVIASMNAKPVFPANPFGGKIAITAHRGFWNCEAAGFSENTIASLKAAQDAGLWGSEFDIHITADDVVIVNHNPDIDGVMIADTPYAELLPYKLPNGESRPTLDEYLTQGAKAKTMLVMEFKPQKDFSREDLMVEKALASLKAHGLYDPSRVMFISFSWHISKRLAKLAPEFHNQFLDAYFAPKRLQEYAINGLDYKYKKLLPHKEWVQDAHKRSMTVNTWTVNKEEDIRAVIDAGVDVITTNYPLLVRQLLNDQEYK